jgi:hypothetical protein
MGAVQPAVERSPGSRPNFQVRSVNGCAGASIGYGNVRSCVEAPWLQIGVAGGSRNS